MYAKRDPCQRHDWAFFCKASLCGCVTSAEPVSHHSNCFATFLCCCDVIDASGAVVRVVIGSVVAHVFSQVFGHIVLAKILHASALQLPGTSGILGVPCGINFSLLRPDLVCAKETRSVCVRWGVYHAVTVLTEPASIPDARGPCP